MAKKKVTKKATKTKSVKTTNKTAKANRPTDKTTDEEPLNVTIDWNMLKVAWALLESKEWKLNLVRSLAQVNEAFEKAHADAVAKKSS